MKKLFLILFFTLIYINVCAQEYNSNINGKTEIVELDSISKKTIQSKAMEWIALNYNSANNVVQLNTEDKIIVKGVFSIDEIYHFYSFGTAIFGAVNIEFNHTLIISIRDNKYKIDISFPDKTLITTILDTDEFYNINEYTLRNEFTLEQRWINVRNNLSKEPKMTDKKIERQIEKYKKNGRIKDNFVFEKNVANKMNSKIDAIFLGLKNSIKSNKNEW